MHTFLRLPVSAFLFILMGAVVIACDSQSPVQEVEREALVLDVRVHLLESAESDGVTTTLSETEVADVFEAVNEVWDQAAIVWRIESIVRAEASDPGPFQRFLDGVDAPSIEAIAGIIPRNELLDDYWDVFLIRDLGGLAGGIYFPSIPAVLQPELDPLGARGLDGGLARILAHELGHALSLPHVPCTADGNLMAPGCFSGDRSRLGEEQIEAARRQAGEGPYSAGVPVYTAESGSGG